MSHIPNDPFILLGYLNTQLRDYYASFSELCQSMNLDPQTINSKLEQAGFVYDPSSNQFK